MAPDIPQKQGAEKQAAKSDMRRDRAARAARRLARFDLQRQGQTGALAPARPPPRAASEEREAQNDPENANPEPVVEDPLERNVSRHRTLREIVANIDRCRGHNQVARVRMTALFQATGTTTTIQDSTQEYLRIFPGPRPDQEELDNLYNESLDLVNGLETLLDLPPLHSDEEEAGPLAPPATPKDEAGPSGTAGDDK